MNIHQDPRITRLIRPGEVHRRRRGRPTAPRNTQLVARHVMLRAAGTSTRMQRDDLGAEEVVARGDGRRDRDVHLAAARVEVLDTPKVVVADLAGWILGPARREDLEPPRGAVGRGGVGDFGEVDLEGAVVRAADGFRGAGAVAGLLWGTESVSGWLGIRGKRGYLVHLDGDGRAGLDGTLALGAAGVAVAADLRGGHVGDGRVREDGARALAAKVDAVDPELLEGGVGRGVLRGEGGREGGDAKRLHLGRVVGGWLRMGVTRERWV